MKKLLLFSYFLFLISILGLPIDLFSQNVGIGTTSPQSRLHINSPADEALRLEANQPYLSLYSNGVYKGYFWKSPNSIEIGSAATSNLPVTIAPDGIQRMIINEQGKVGIGTIAPTQTLDVNGTLRIRQGNPGMGKILSSDANGNASWIDPSSIGSGGGAGFGAWGDCSMRNISAYNPVADDAGLHEDVLGSSVAISGNFAIVGAPVNASSGPVSRKGSASIYQFNGTNWVFFQKISDPNSTNSRDYFGNSVAISGDHIIVGSPAKKIGSNIFQGSVSFFKYDGTSWIFQQNVSDPDGATFDGFGTSVSIFGNDAVAGTPFANGGTGYAYMMHYDGSTWSLTQKLTEPTGSPNDQFGTAVSLSGNYLAVGSPFDDITSTDMGSVTLFEFNGTNWSRVDIITMVLNGTAFFGASVSLNGNQLLAGAPGDIVNSNNAQGSVHYFKRSSSWDYKQSITRSDGASNDFFGSSVSVSPNYMVIGSYGDQVGNNLSQGSASIYQRMGIGWQLLQFTTDPAGEPSERFGTSVSLDTNSPNFLIGSPGFMNDLGKAIFGKIN
jgi:hypothetical protein